jgi:hypothetical protein
MGLKHIITYINLLTKQDEPPATATPIDRKYPGNVEMMVETSSFPHLGNTVRHPGQCSCGFLASVVSLGNATQRPRSCDLKPRGNKVT